MRYKDIRRHMKPYSIVASRTTTINHAFASAVAPHDRFDPKTVIAALRQLDQNPDETLLCVYCDTDAETWDHVYATVSKKVFSGYGHRLGNLLPCCKRCNSKKGSRDWKQFLQSNENDDPFRVERERRIDEYLKAYLTKDQIPEQLPEYKELQEVRLQVLKLLAKADELANVVRSKAYAI
jgi:5-methylcytosine-specific restriction endonuclease McrA